MTQPKHTPGPWRVDRSTTNQVTLMGGTSHIIMAPSAETPCAFVSGYDNDGGTEGPANARLIAAAPELLEALKMWRERISSPDGVDLQTMLHLTDEAISKAEVI